MTKTIALPTLSILTKIFVPLLIIAACATNVKAAGLSDVDKAYIVNMTAGLAVAIKCNGKPITGGMVKFADRNGVDSEMLTKAMKAALAVNADTPYDRDDLIPAVTRFMTEVAGEVMSAIEKNKIGACARWIKVLRENGVVE